MFTGVGVDSVGMLSCIVLMLDIVLGFTSRVCYGDGGGGVSSLTDGKVQGRLMCVCVCVCLCLRVTESDGCHR